MPDAEWPTRVRRMALTHAEFLRSLPRAAPHMGRRIDGAEIELSDPPRRVVISLGPEQSRRLGALALPETEVRIRLEGFSGQERQAFLERFDLAFRRGGG
jgi:hypothetical protein